ncbi:MAG TPA: hypothetical protein VH475_27990 [Tepidisphaeraceae bacterium]|jgi:hypothetical protein
MLTRWIIRFVVVVTFLLIGAFAGAEPASDGGTATTPPSGGSAGAAPRAPVAPVAPVRPAPTPAPRGNPPAPTNPPPARANNNPTPPRPAAQPNPPVQPPRSANVASTPPQRTQRAVQQPPPRQRPTTRPGSIGRRGPIVVVPQYYNGWAPYTWWWRGNSYWMPDYGYGDGYYGDGYRGDGYTNDDAAGTPGVNNTTPSDIPSATQDQAKANNAVQGLPEYNQAMLELKQAQAAYDAASTRVLEQLKRNNPQYRELLNERDHAKDKVEAEQAAARIPGTNVPDAAQVAPAAKQKLDVSARVTKLEQDALAADPQASAARAKLVEANERLSALRKQAQSSGSPGQ